MSIKKFVPEDFEIPASLETEFFRLRMLSVDDVEKDYEAVIESRELLQTKFGVMMAYSAVAIAAKVSPKITRFMKVRLTSKVPLIISHGIICE